MRLLRTLAVAAGTSVVVTLAAGAAYVLYVAGFWRRALRAIDPFDPAEPI